MTLVFEHRNQKRRLVFAQHGPGLGEEDLTYLTEQGIGINRQLAIGRDGHPYVEGLFVEDPIISQPADGRVEYFVGSLTDSSAKFTFREDALIHARSLTGRSVISERDLAGVLRDQLGGGALAGVF